jgi:hypothetical protein
VGVAVGVGVGVGVGVELGVGVGSAEGECECPAEGDGEWLGACVDDCVGDGCMPSEDVGDGVGDVGAAAWWSLAWCFGSGAGGATGPRARWASFWIGSGRLLV